MDFVRPRRSVRIGRWGNLAVVVLLHFGFIAAFILAIPHFYRRDEPPQEAVLILTAAGETTKPKRTQESGGGASYWYVLPPSVLRQLGPQSSISTEEGRLALGRALFSCAPDNWHRLTEEERGKCARRGGFVADLRGSLVMVPHPYVRSADGWRREAVRSQQPMVVPGGIFGLMGAIIDGSIFDSESTIRNPQHWPTAQDVKETPREALTRRRNTADACVGAAASHAECNDETVSGRQSDKDR
jgi:hypothetical protein